MITNYNPAPEELWRKQKAKLKLRFSQLDDEDFQYDYGMREVMMTKLQLKLGKSRKELQSILASF